VATQKSNQWTNSNLVDATLSASSSFREQKAAPDELGVQAPTLDQPTPQAGVSGATGSPRLKGQALSDPQKMAWLQAGLANASDLTGVAPDLFSAVLEASPDTICVADATHPDMPIVYVNPSFTRTTGYEAHEALGRNCRFLQGPQTDPATVRQLAEAVKNQRSCEVEILNYRRDGEAFVNALKLTPIFDVAGKLVAYLGIQKDISEEKLRNERDRIANRLEALGLAAGALAHEVNNLLQPAVSLLSLHEPDIADPCMRNDIEIVRESTLQAAEISNNLLALTRGAAAAPQGLTSVEAALERTEKLLRVMVPYKIRLMIKSDRLAPCTQLAMSETDFFQLIMNTVLNASQATGNNGLVVVEAHTNASGFCEISISDNGPGIPPCNREKVLRPFCTFGNSRGSGLGLHIVKTIVDTAGGTLDIADGLPSNRPENFGCQVRLTLPIIRNSQ